MIIHREAKSDKEAISLDCFFMMGSYISSTFVLLLWWLQWFSKETVRAEKDMKISSVHDNFS